MTKVAKKPLRRVRSAPPKSVPKTTMADDTFSIDERVARVLSNILSEAGQIEGRGTRELWLDSLQTFARTGSLEELLKACEWRRQVVPMNEFLFSKIYLGMDEAAIYPAVIGSAHDLDTDEYVEAVLTGAIGSGKSTLSNIMLARNIYKLSCMRYPQSSLGIQSKSSIVFTIQSVRFNTAKKAIFEELGQYINPSIYFKKVFPYDHKVVSQMIFREFNISILPVASGTTGAISMNVLGGILDEVNFMQKVTKSQSTYAEVDGTFDQARALYTTLSRRRRSRFTKKGKLPGCLYLVSSSRFPTDFTEDKAKESAMEGGNDNKIYVFRHSQWSAKGRDQFLPEDFRVQVGNDRIRSKVLKDNEKVMPGCEEIPIPIDFLSDFQKDVDGSLRDFAGRTSLALNPFFGRRDAIQECMTLGTANGYSSPFNVEVMDLSVGIPKPDITRLRLDVESFRTCHIDLGLNKDACGIAVGHIAGVKVSEKKMPGTDKVSLEILPVIGIDLAIRIVPPMNGEIEFARVRELLYALRNVYNLDIKYVTLDGFQCLSGDTDIWTDRGMVKASEVIEGDIVQSRCGPKPVTKIWSFGKKDTLIIDSSDGSFIEVTDKHKLEVAVGWKYITIVPGRRENGGKQCRVPVWGWVCAKDMKIGDIVRSWDGYTEVMPKDLVTLKSPNKAILPVKLTEEIAEVLGLIWGDGNIGKRHIAVTAAAEEKDDAVDILKRLNLNICISPYKEEKCWNLRINSDGLIWWLQVNGLIKSSEYIPEAILRSPVKVQAAFIRGLFSADGTVKRRDGQSSLSTKNLVWANYVQNFLRMACSIQSNITIVDYEYGGDYCKRVQYILQVRGSRQLFKDSIGFCYSTKIKELDKHLSIKGRNLYTKIKSIRKSKAEVFDFEVKDDHSYLANGFVSHNSIDSRQILRRHDFQTEYLSVEKMEPYRAFRDAMYDGRVLLPKSNILSSELSELEIVVSNNKEKVDHRVGGRKDVSDAVCGVVSFLLKRRAAWAGLSVDDRVGMHLLGERQGIAADSMTTAAMGLSFSGRKLSVRKGNMNRKKDLRKDINRLTKSTN